MLLLFRPSASAANTGPTINSCPVESQIAVTNFRIRNHIFPKLDNLPIIVFYYS